MVLGGAAWFFNVAGHDSGPPALLVGLPALAFLVARRSLRRVPEPGLWLAATVVIALITAGIVAAQAVPGHRALESRLDELAGFERSGAVERTGRTTCRPSCAGVVARYRFSAAPDVALASVVAVLTNDGFELADGQEWDGSAGSSLRLRDGKASALIEAEPTDDGSSLAVTLQGRR